LNVVDVVDVEERTTRLEGCDRKRKKGTGNVGDGRVRLACHSWLGASKVEADQDAARLASNHHKLISQPLGGQRGLLRWREEHKLTFNPLSYTHLEAAIQAIQASTYMSIKGPCFGQKWSEYDKLGFFWLE
jgi:hypothetical protein